MLKTMINNKRRIGNFFKEEKCLDIKYTKNPFQRISFNTTLRQLEVNDTILSFKDVENTLQGRIEFDFQFFRRFIRSKTFYQMGTGQEQKREFQYLQVQAGNGLYICAEYLPMEKIG